MAGVMTSLKVYGDNHSFALRAPRYIDNLNLTAGTAKSLTVPSGAVFAFFVPVNGVNFAVAYDTTAVFPVADITDGTAPDLNPVGREIMGITTLSVISNTNTEITVLFYGN